MIKKFQVLVSYFTTPLCTTTFSGVLTEAYLESGRTSTMEGFFAEILNSFKVATIFAKNLLVWVENRLLAKRFKILSSLLLPVCKLRSCWESKRNECLCRSSRPKGSFRKAL